MNPPKKMTKQVADDFFRNHVLPSIFNAEIFPSTGKHEVHTAMRRYAWENFVKFMAENFVISDRQFCEWKPPSWLFTDVPA